jgi:hypothetical protein
MATVAMLVGSVVSTGGLTALVVKIRGSKKSESEQVLENSMERRNENGEGSE